MKKSSLSIAVWIILHKCSNNSLEKSSHGVEAQSSESMVLTYCWLSGNSYKCKYDISVFSFSCQCTINCLPLYFLFLARFVIFIILFVLMVIFIGWSEIVYMKLFYIHERLRKHDEADSRNNKISSMVHPDCYCWDNRRETADAVHAFIFWEAHISKI